MASSHTADVVIVGGGLIGCSIAWKLFRRGIGVALLEAGFVGGEASGASAGMLAPGGEVDRRTDWGDAAVESLRRYPGFVAELSEQSGRTIDFRRCGALELAFSEGERVSLVERGERQRAFAIPSEPVLPADLPPVVSSSVRGALFYRDDSLVDPRDLLVAISTVLGDRIHEQERVTAIDLGVRGVEIKTANSSWSARAAVLAAGAWSSQIAVRMQHLLSPVTGAFPIKGHLAGYDLTPGSLASIVRHQHTYVLQRASGLTIAGSTDERVGFDRSIVPAQVAGIHQRARNLTPRLLPEVPSSAWMGFRPAVQFPYPELRRFQNSSLWLAYGHYRNGVLLTPFTADRISAEVIAALERESA